MRWLLVVLVVGCTSDPLSDTRAAVTGTWDRTERDPATHTWATYGPDGAFQLTTKHDDVASQYGGRWRLTGTAKAPMLGRCIEGDKCKTGGLWESETIGIIGDNLIVGTQTGDRWNRRK